MAPVAVSDSHIGPFEKVELENNYSPTAAGCNQIVNSHCHIAVV